MVVERGKAVLSVFGLWAVWTLATWVFEGRVDTLLRPDAVLDRLVYTGVANILVGIIGAALLLGLLVRSSRLRRDRMGFGSPVRTLVWLPIGIALGLALYVGQGAPTAHPTVILNAYAQVLVVSMAEVLVCWAVVAGTLCQSTGLGGRLAIPLAAIVASVLFGLYHFAHSPPFNTVAMVGFLAGIGLLTSAFFFLSRDVYATIAFHNFLGVFGVLQALIAQEKLAAYETLQGPLLATALAALIVLVLADVFFIRRSTAAHMSSP